MSAAFKLEHEGQFRLITDLLTEGFLVQNSEGVVLTYNRALLNLLGLNLQQLNGEKNLPNYWKLIDENFNEIDKENDLRKQVVDSKQEIKNKVVGVIYSSHGEVRWLSVTIRMLYAFDKTDNIYIISNYVDVTDIQNQKSQIRESKMWHQAILDSAQLAVIATCPNGTILTFNRYAEKLLGYEASELVGLQNPGIFHLVGEVTQKATELTKSLQRKIEPGFETFIARPKYQSIEDTNEWTYLHKNGHRIPVRLTVSAIRSSDGEIQGYLGIARDLTVQKQQQKIHEENKRLLDAHIHALNESAIVAFTDPRGVITYVNKQFEEISGYSSSVLIGKTHQIINSGTHESQFFTDMWKKIKQKEIWRGQVCNRSKKGELVLG